jgi:hypothetical protein
MSPELREQSYNKIQRCSVPASALSPGALLNRDCNLLYNLEAEPF